VTLLHAPQARLGAEFVYAGPMPECGECRVRAACLNQQPGRRYRVTAVRDVRHPCPLTGDEVAVVEVDPAAPPMSWWTRTAVRGSTIAYEPLDCDRRDCRNFPACHPRGIGPGERLRLLQVEERFDCPLGYEIHHVAVAYETAAARAQASSAATPFLARLR